MVPDDENSDDPDTGRVPHEACPAADVELANLPSVGKPAGKLLRACRFAAERPLPMYGVACGSYCGFFVLLIVLAASLGDSFFPFKSEVPLYLRGHVTRIRFDALSAAKDEANFVFNLPEVQLRSSASSLGGDREDLTLEVIYLPSGGSVFEMKTIRSIWEFEQKVVSFPQYTDRCRVKYTAAEIASRESEDWDEVRRINAEPHPCEVQNTVFYACDPSAGYPCDSILSTPIGILNCESPSGQTCSVAEMSFTEAFKDAKLSKYSDTAADTSTPEGLNAYQFLRLVDSGFGSGSLVAKAVRTEFLFGVPFAGYDTIIDDADGQSALLAEWLFDELTPELASMQTNDDIDIVYHGHELLSLYLNSILMRDAMFALASMAFVFLYMAFMLHSVFLAMMGLAQIILSFAPAYFLYYGVFQQRFFGIFNVLSIFIILGIGADDIFVFLDTWAQSESKCGGSDVARRLSYTLSHAGKAMLITSLSTVFSFMSNATSSFPAIQTFGIFAALLVLVNYCAVMLYFPTVVIVYEKYFVDIPFLCGLAQKIRTLASGGYQVEPVSKSDFVEKKTGATSEDDLYSYVPQHEEPRPNRWFRESFGNFVIGANLPILLVFVAVITLLSISASQIEVDKGTVRLLPDGDNFQRFLDVKPEYFVRGGSINSIQVDLVWGLDKDNPIDRAGTAATDSDNVGKVVWDPQFDLAIAANCIISICAAAEAKSDDRKTGGKSTFPISCVLADFKAHVVSTRGSADWAAMTGVAANRTLFDDALYAWVTDPEVYSEVSQYFYIVGEGNTIKQTLFVAELKLTATNTEVEPKEGIALWEVWEAFVAEQYTRQPCLSVKEHAGMFQNSFVDSFVKDRLVSEAFFGIILSISLAFAVLAVATQNVIIALYATLTILCIVASVIGTTVIMGWKLGILESVGFVMVPGLSVDFVAHFADSYVESIEVTRIKRVQDMLAHTGMAVISGAFSTLGATTFLFFPKIIFFQKFGILIFITIAYSLLWALFFFPALLSTPLGPQGDVGNWYVFAVKLYRKHRPLRPDTPPVAPAKIVQDNS
eukprot:gene14786-22634_t